MHVAVGSLPHSFIPALGFEAPVTFNDQALLHLPMRLPAGRHHCDESRREGGQIQNFIYLLEGEIDACLPADGRRRSHDGDA